MAENTSIEWADYSWNAWIGCTKVDEGCRNCYAEAQTARFGQAKWGPAGPRVTTSESNWRNLHKWHKGAALERYLFDAIAERAGYFSEAVSFGAIMPPDRAAWNLYCKAADRLAKRGLIAIGANDFGLTARRLVPTYNRPRVFVNSLSDFFEAYNGPIVDHKGKPALTTLATLRGHALEAFRSYNELTFIVLTKGPGNIPAMMDGQHHENLWLLASVSDQATANVQVPRLLACRKFAPVLGLSGEPLLGPIDLTRIEDPSGQIVFDGVNGVYWFNDPDADPSGQETPPDGTTGDRINWIIAGGESGRNARPMHPEWSRALRDQCDQTRVPFFFKQWGEWAPKYRGMRVGPGVRVVAIDQLGDEYQRGDYVDPAAQVVPLCRVGKKEAGRLLDGQLHHNFPADDFQGCTEERSEAT